MPADSNTVLEAILEGILLRGGTDERSANQLSFWEREIIDPGRKALYVNRLMTHHILDLPRDESEALLNEIFEHQERLEFVYEHVWTPGDVLLWDNRCTLHARSDFDASERRMMRRVAILGDKPA